jgi:RNA polymerase sigma factor (sigma-70 family)
VADAPSSTIVRLIRQMADTDQCTDMSDCALLERFRSKRDEDAFQALVRRHGAMVLRACRNVLAHEQDAEDAFQATFLVLARRHGSIRKKESLAGWLHGVAHRTALYTKRTAGRRRVRERQAIPVQSPDPARELSWREVQAILDEEIDRLPDKLRTPFVMCILEGRRGLEVARELRLKEGTVWSRLAEARSRLQKRLTRRGLSLPMVLAGAVASTDLAAAFVPASLFKKTAGIVSLTGDEVATNVETLASGASNAMFGSKLTTKLKAGIACLVLVGVVAAGTTWLPLDEAGAQQSLTETKEQPKPEPAKDDKRKPAGVPSIEESKEAVTFNAQVLGPNGKPFAGAEAMLGWWQPFGREWFPWIVSPFQPKGGATSDEDGRLRITMTKAEIFAAVDTPRDEPWRLFQLVVSAKGYAPGFVTLEAGQKDLTIQLMRDVPATGVVLDLQGRPVAGARVRVDHMKENGGNRILFVNSWPGLPASFTTDKDGRFTLTGIGPGRHALLHINGTTIEHKIVEVTTPAENEKPKGDIVKLFVGPTKPIRGIVRDKTTGKPLAGVEVYGDREAHRGGVRALTDKDGRYELLGLPKAGSWELEAFPTGSQPYLATHQFITDSEGLKPIDADLTLRKGIPVRLQVIDKVTRQPVRGVVRYSPLLGNPLHSEARRPASNWASHLWHLPNKDHGYDFVAFPGPGIIYAWVAGSTHLPASLLLDPADEKNGYTMRDGKDPIALGWLALFEGYRIIDPEATDKALSVVIELDPGRTIKGTLQGSDGKPVAGAIAYGLNHNPKFDRGDSSPPREQNLKGPTFAATGLHPKATRTISFIHKNRKLVGYAILRGDEKEDIAVTLQEWGVVVGRLLDAGGKPLAGVGVQAHYPALPAPGIWPAVQASTDAEGRFRLEGLMTNVRLSPVLTGKSDAKLSAEALKDLTLKPGETKELGDIRVKAAPAKKRADGDDK